MDVSGLVSGNLLKATDVKKPATLTIAGADLRELGDGGEKLILSFDGTDKELVLNKTRLLALIEAYGAETQVWLGQKIVLSTAPVNFRGQLTKTITVTPAEIQAPTAVSHNGQDDNPFEDEDIPF